MLVKKSVLNEISKEGTFTQGFKDDQKGSISKFRQPSKLAGKVNLTVKASAEKTWLFHEFPFSVNPGDKPNDVQT